MQQGLRRLLNMGALNMGRAPVSSSGSHQGRQGNGSKEPHQMPTAPELWLPPKSPHHPLLAFRPIICWDHNVTPLQLDRPSSKDARKEDMRAACLIMHQLAAGSSPDPLDP